jgi:predicted  nucleic acid-binding Zn-ribbon protein
MLNNVLKSVGLIKIKDHDKELEVVKQEAKANHNNYIAVSISEKDLQYQIKQLFEKMDKLQKDNELKDVQIDNLRTDNDQLKNKVSKQKVEINHLLDIKHKLSKENPELRSTIATLKKDYNSLKKQLEGRIGGFVKELNKIKSQYRFLLSIYFKAVRIDKDTEIFLSHEYDKYQQWDIERKQVK